LDAGEGIIAYEMASMRLLLINTCGLEGVVALAEDSAVVELARLPGRGSSEHLMPAVRQLMDGRGWRVRDLAAIGVVIGPGSFTGVRAGLSAAKGLCEAGAVGMVALSRLELVAAAVEGKAVALLDAGRGEFYCGVYRDGVRMGEDLIKADAVPALRNDGVLVTCEVRVAETLGSGVLLVAEPGPSAMLALVLRRIEAGDWSDVAAVDANYLRRTDAELLVKGR
jgi:tRNA threonylcarbamoyladenosine biosynthesis protein TsaB